ncbi:hypothetical protein AAZV13_05G081600 [Glycine max]
MMPHPGVLVGFIGVKTKVRDYVNLETTFGDKGAKTPTIQYMVVNTPSTYNILLRRPLMNKLEEIVLTAYLKVKFPLDHGLVGVISVHREITCRCYYEILRAKRELYGLAKHYGVHFVELDPRRDFIDQYSTSMEEVKELEIGKGKKVKIGTTLTHHLEDNLLEVLKHNSNDFAWSSSDMSGIDLDFLYHKLAFIVG